LHISTPVRNWIIVKHASVELKLEVAASSDTGNAIIKIEGGFLVMPGRLAFTAAKQ
jgi:hypothetical protein